VGVPVAFEGGVIGAAAVRLCFPFTRVGGMGRGILLFRHVTGSVGFYVTVGVCTRSRHIRYIGILTVIGVIVWIGFRRG
jgi:hypothetical protein